MKLNLLTPALAALVLACAPVCAHAQTNTMSSSTTTSTSTSTMAKTPYRGTITAVDASANSITVQGAKGSMTLMVSGETKYKGGSSLSDFAVGDKVTGSYMKDASGMMTASSVHKKMMKSATTSSTTSSSTTTAPAAQ